LVLGLHSLSREGNIRIAYHLYREEKALPTLNMLFGWPSFYNNSILVSLDEVPRLASYRYTIRQIRDFVPGIIDDIEEGVFGFFKEGKIRRVRLTSGFALEFAEEQDSGGSRVESLGQIRQRDLQGAN